MRLSSSAREETFLAQTNSPLDSLAMNAFLLVIETNLLAATFDLMVWLSKITSSDW